MKEWFYYKEAYEKPNKPMAQQTALEIFWEQIEEILPFSVDYVTAIRLYEKYQAAKQMEREQHGNTWDEAIKAHEDRGHVTARSICDFDDYYTQTYGTRLQNETN